MDRPDAHTLVRWFGWGVLGVVVFVVVAAITVVLLLNRNIDRVDVDGLGEDAPGESAGSAGADDGGTDGDSDAGADGATDARALTVLVLGSDSRESLSPEERTELGTGDAPGERMESIMLVRLDPDADELRILSVPRDTLITRCDGSRGRINAAYAIGERSDLGGPSCMVQTLRDWHPLRIDHVAMIDFSGFVDIVDAVGGVPMVLEEPIVDENANLDLDAGCTRLDGAQALAFVRARSIDDDFGRMQRQQRFLEELRREIAAVGILDDLPRLLRTADAGARATELDSSLTLNRIRMLAQQHRDTLRLPVEGRSLPGTIDPSSDTAFLEVAEEDAREGFAWLVAGDPASGGDADDDPASGGGAADDAGTGRTGAGDTGTGDGMAGPDALAGPDAGHVAGDPSPGTADDGSPPC